MNRLSTMCVVVALFGVACASPNLGDPQRSASKTLGVEGGEVLAKNGVGVVVPKGALSKAVLITVAPGEASHPAPPGIPVGELYEFSPEGLSFSIPAKVRLEVDLSRLPAGYSIGNIVVQRAPLGTSTFERLTTRVVDATHVEADTLHFSVFVPTLEGLGSGGNDGGSDGGTMCSETCGAGNDAGVDCSCARTCGQTLWEIECSGSSPLGCACVRNGVQVSSLSLPVCPGVGDIARYCDVQDGGVDGGSDGGVFPDGGVSDGGSDGGVFTDGGVSDGGSDGGVFTDGGVPDGGSDGGVFTDGGTDGGTRPDGGTDGGFSDGGSDGGVFTDGGVDGGTDGGTRDGGADAGP